MNYYGNGNKKKKCRWSENPNDKEPQKYGRPFYNKYFEDTQEEIIIDKRGKKKIMRTYIGQYYMQELDQRGRVMHIIICLLLYIGAAASFCGGAFYPAEVNFTKWIVIPVCAGFLSFILTLAVLVAYMSAGRKLRIYDYKSTSVALKRYTIVDSAAMGAAAFITVFYGCTVKSQTWKETWLCAGSYLISMLFSLALHRKEKRVKYIICRKNPE